MSETIGIDFSFISRSDIKNEILTGSVSIFLGDLLDEIAALGETDRFVVIINACAEEFFKERFPTFKYCLVGAFLPKVIGRLAPGRFTRIFKRSGLYKQTLTNNGVIKIWFPWMVPEEVNPVGCEYVGTCHDLIMRDANSDEACKEMFAKAKMTICISRFVKQQVMDLYNISNNIISVIPNSLKADYASAKIHDVPELVDKKYILDVNAYVPRKNTLVLLQAYKSICEQIDYELVFCGGYKDDAYFDKCIDFIKENKLNSRVHVFYAVEESKKNWLLQNCSLFVTPSENEGFGRTPIEAALSLKPVISTRATALEESTCGLLHYIDNPRDVQELADKILQVLQQPSAPEELTRIRQILAGKYNPQKIVEQYLQVFREIGWIKE